VPRDVPERPRHRLFDRPRASRVGIRAAAVCLAAALAALIGTVLAGCGGGGGGGGTATSSAADSNASRSTASTTSTDARSAENELGSPAAVHSVVERVLTSFDPADACGRRYVTQRYLSTAYGGKEACVQAQRPGIAATSISSFRIDDERGQGRAVDASVVLHGGPYDGSTAKVGLLFESGRYRIDSLGANVPVGP
jgi:hypothetical protein